jgi:uncharacterized membrane protein YgcG
MRRILVSLFAVLATFSVLANNFIPVSAPASDGISLHTGSAPQGMARLSNEPVYSPVSRVHVPSAAVEQPQPDLSAFAPHSVSTEVAKAEAVQPPVVQEPYVSASTQKPAASFQPAKLEPIPSTVGTEILSNESEKHYANNVVGDVNAVRMTSSPEAVTTPPAYVATAGEQPIDFFNPRTQSDVPSAGVDTAILAGSGEHQALRSNTGVVAERTTFSADVASFVPKMPEFITASYQAPESIFQRARFVVEPTAPSIIETLAVSGDHRVQTDAADGNLERTSASAETTWLPAFIATVSEFASDVFGRERIAMPTEELSAAEVLASNETHSLSGNTDAVIERQPNATAESAPYLPSFISTLAVAPSAVFQKVGLLPVPEAPASVDTFLASNEDHSLGGSTVAAISTRGTATPDMAIAPVRSSPVLISSDTSMNASMLKPMSAGPLVNAPLLNENAVASSGYNATPFDRMIASPDVPEAILKAQPTLISSKTEFSSDLLKPMNAVATNPFVSLSKEEIIAAAQQRDNYCDPNFVGQPIRFSQTVELKLDDLLRQLHQRFGVNFIVGKGVADLPMNIKAGSIPWNVLLKSQLFLSGVRARCIDANTIELVENQELPRLQDGADVETRFVKLKFLQRTSSGSVDLAGRGSSGGGQNGQGGGCSAGGGQGGGLSGGGGGGQGGGQQSETAATQSSSKFDKLVIEIEKILGLRSMTESSAGGQGGQGGGQSQGQTTEAVRTNRFVTQIPGRNILVIRATDEEHALIDQIIERADRPPFQVVVKGLVYTANQDKLRDIGVSTSIFGGTADGRHTGSVVGNALGTGGTIFDFSTIIGTFDFNVQARALEESGVLSVKSRPFSTVIDGLCARLNVGRSIPIIIDSSLGGQGALEFIDALNKLDVTPHVIDDENGNPIAVTLELTMFANDVDNSVIARGVPAVSERSIQTQLLLAEDKTAILGGFTVDQASRTVEKTPGIGDIPIIGQLFKRRVNDKRVNRLYFAISVDVIPYPEAIRPVDVPGATTDIPSITPEQKKRADAAEPKQVKGP